MPTREHAFEHVCQICGAPLDSQGVTSEVYGGVVCAECARIERIGFFWCGGGAIVIVLLWAITQILYHAGLVGKAVHGAISLRWAPLWFFVCVLVIYFRLNKRKRLHRTTRNGAGASP